MTDTPREPMAELAARLQFGKAWWCVARIHGNATGSITDEELTDANAKKALVAVCEQAFAEIGEAAAALHNTPPGVEEAAKLLGVVHPTHGYIAIRECVKCRQPYPEWCVVSRMTCPDCRKDTSARPTDEALRERVEGALREIEKRARTSLGGTCAHSYERCATFLRAALQENSDNE